MNPKWKLLFGQKTVIMPNFDHHSIYLKPNLRMKLINNNYVMFTVL